MLRPTWAVRGGKGQPKHLMLVEELSWGTDFDHAAQESEEHRWHASPQSRFERLLRETGVSIGLLVSPGQIRLVYAPKGESSGHVTFPIHQMTMAANWPMLAALHLLLHSDRLFIGPENQRLPAILEASRRYQNEVSIRLAGQVLRALNELVRGFQEADRAAHGSILREALRHDPNHIYGGMLTTLMRMVFVLYAEDRSLMGSDETWLQNYSISGLYDRLRADAGQYPDTMDSRYGAWAQIVTLTRLLYDGGGHGSWRLPPRHGGLFDPDAYPFLEGRAWESKRTATALIEPPLVSDGILFRILQDLLYLDGERISYRALDVEQIGSVYEAMMGFTVETAHGISIGLGSDHLVIDLEYLLMKKPAERPKWLKENADCEVTGKAIERLKSAAAEDELLAALRRRISKLYLDQNSNPVTVPPDGIYLQPTEERRRSGSHYTPRSLTQPIVKTTLDPVLAQLGDNPTPDQILGLKVCDPAMGSGAFLVEACRYLGEKLEKTWNAHRLMPPIPADQDPLLHARRIVAQRCLYGVDKNPFAVNLAKLSLWLATFAKDHPFTFVDHTLRCGDSLVGLTAHQVEAFHWQPKEEGALLRDLPSRLRHILNARALILDAADETPYEMLAQKLATTDEQMIDLRLAGDLTVAAFFASDKLKERESRRKTLAEQFRRAQEQVTDLEIEDELQRAVRVLKTGPRSVSPFHWEVEFPEVFERENAGFDAIVGNPPFLGGTRISNSIGRNYLAYLVEATSRTTGNVDLAAFFLRRSDTLLRVGGALGLISTNSVKAGDSGRSSLSLLRASRRELLLEPEERQWPGASANVAFVPVCWLKLQAELKDALTPRPLVQNRGICNRGCDVFGAGFVLTEREVSEIQSDDPVSSEVIRPYIGGEEFNNSPTLQHSRYIINFGEMQLEEVQRFRAAFGRVERLVRPARATVQQADRRNLWWLYATRSPSVERFLSRHERVLAIGQMSKHLAFAFLPKGVVFSNSLLLILDSSHTFFCMLQSRVHAEWVMRWAGAMRQDVRYTSTDCFETFPLPSDWQSTTALEIAGKMYYAFRATLMVRNNEGLTKTYNRFHDPDERAPDIINLRELHAEMDRAVLNAYGWTDLHPRLDFILNYQHEEDDEGSVGRDHKKPWRYRWVDEDRDKVVARLLDLNRTRAEEEANSPPDVSEAKRPAKRGTKSNKLAPVASPRLVDVQESTE